MQPSIILVNPQMGANIGAAARVMFNFGLTDLRLVSPRDGWPNIEAERNSAGALEAMPDVQVFNTLADAVADLHFVLATTARPRDMVKSVYTPQMASSEMRKRAQEGMGCGFVFGAERTGLVNDDIAICHGIINIPTNPDFSSLNLGQAVLLCAWEWFRTQDETHGLALPVGDSFPAKLEDLMGFLDRLENALDDGGFFKAPDLKPTMLRNIRAMFTRSGLTDQELRTLHGILSALADTKKRP